ncbi:MAG: hypothetical protein JWQ11_1545 [Rhizobacter sp.]|nr:hypothetical protein [Rhizobacter sp.]
MSKTLARRLALVGLSVMLAGSALAQPASGASVDSAASGSIAPAASSPDKAAVPGTVMPPTPADTASTPTAPPAMSAPTTSPATSPAASPATSPTASTKPVTTLARVVSLRAEPASDMNVRLKLMPRFPYAIQTFRVTDRSQLEGLSEGSWIRFTSKRMDGVNTVDTVEPVAECKRMAVCGMSRTTPVVPVSSSS